MPVAAGHPRRQSVEFAQTLDWVGSLIANGTKGGAWTAPCPRLMAAMLFGGFHGAVDEEIVAPARTSRKRLNAEVRRFCRNALGLTA